jgi:hypothetical protein
MKHGTRPRYRVKRHAVEQPSNPLYKRIALTQGQSALVDAHNYDRLMQRNWTAQWNSKTKSFYATGRKWNKSLGRSTPLAMARVILGLPDDDPRQGDHRNHDTLDNTEQNLRIGTPRQNSQNQQRSNKNGFKGVHKRGKKWGAYFSAWNINRYVGLYATREEAARAYDEWARMFFGEWAHTNF